jgi:hypothetical protein
MARLSKQQACLHAKARAYLEKGVLSCAPASARLLLPTVIETHFGSQGIWKSYALK